MDNNWYDNFIKDLDIDDCFLSVSSYKNGISGYEVLTVNNSEYTQYREWLKPDDTGKTIYNKYEENFLALMNDPGVHVYRYENNRLAEHKCFTDYDGQLYDGHEVRVVLFTEYGIEPADEKGKSALKKTLKDAEKLKDSLVWACYINNTELIAERAAKAAKAQLNRVFSGSTPLTFCAKSGDLIGFKAIAESGADISKSCAGYTPLNWALTYSPEIVLYIHENYPENFDKEVNKKGFNTLGLEGCNDIRVLELFRSYGFDMSRNGSDFPPLLNFADNNNVVGIQFLIDNGVDFMNIRNKYKQTALDRAERRGKGAQDAYALLKKLEDERSD